MPTIHEAALEAVKHEMGAIGRPPARLVVFGQRGAVLVPPRNPQRRPYNYQPTLQDLLSVDWIGGPLEFVARLLDQRAGQS